VVEHSHPRNASSQNHGTFVMKCGDP
jgi:hypothetical protein